MNDKSSLIPQQREGRSIDVEESVGLNSPEEAAAFFDTVCSRLLDVNKWRDIAGKISADFKLVDRKGHEIDSRAKEGDFIRVDIPGPGPKAGDGYDWVEVEQIENIANGESRNLSLRVRPASSPLNDTPDIAHFYSPESTSTFTVTLQGNQIKAGVYDRNTKPNTSSDSLQDKVRDTAVGAAAVTAFSKIQWTNLAKGLLSQEG